MTATCVGAAAVLSQRPLKPRDTVVKTDPFWVCYMIKAPLAVVAPRLNVLSQCERQRGGDQNNCLSENPFRDSHATE